MQLLLVLVVAAVLGELAEAASVPAGVFVGAMVGAAAVRLLVGGPGVVLPRALDDGAFVVLGASVGLLVTKETLASLRGVVLPAVLAGLLIILAGLGITFLLRALGIAPPGDVLATSPGALSNVAAVARREGTGAVEVSLFHLVRLVMVILSLPFVGRFLERPG